jgi:hypothetical protein
MPQLGQQAAKDVLMSLIPGWRKQREEANRVDAWYKGDHLAPAVPGTQPTKEYEELQHASVTPWGSLVVTTVAQALYVEGYRADQDRDNQKVWNELWQPNGFDSRQMAVHRAALAHGLSYVTVFPGTDELTGVDRSVIRGVSARKMAAFFDDDGEDEFPVWSLRGEASRVGDSVNYLFRLYDDEFAYYLSTDEEFDHPVYIETRRHGTGVNPVVRFANDLDLDGRATGEIAPFVPLFQRIDQDTFDRLIVQRFGSWKVRYVAGMIKPPTDEEQRAASLKLRVEDLLVSSSSDTKFGTLDATPLDGYIKARDADIRDLAAVSQTPPHHLLGQMANLSAEALAAAESSLMRKVEERKHSFGESWERVLRLGAHVAGDTDSAANFTSQVRWRDTESRSLAQSADALGKLATMLQVPVEMLWDRIPGWTNQDTEDAKRLIAENGALQELFTQLTANATPNAGQQTEQAPDANGA